MAADMQQPRSPVRPIITLTTDFGTRDFYAPLMKAVLLKHCPDARLIDITHHVPRHDVLCGSITLERTPSMASPKARSTLRSSTPVSAPTAGCW